MKEKEEFANSTLSQTLIDQIHCACPEELKWDMKVSCSGLDHIDASVLQGCDRSLAESYNNKLWTLTQARSPI